MKHGKQFVNLSYNWGETGTKCFRYEKLGFGNSVEQIKGHVQEDMGFLQIKVSFGGVQTDSTRLPRLLRSKPIEGTFQTVDNFFPQKIEGSKGFGILFIIFGIKHKKIKLNYTIRKA